MQWGLGLYGILSAQELDIQWLMDLEVVTGSAWYTELDRICAECSVDYSSITTLFCLAGPFVSPGPVEGTNLILFVVVFAYSSNVCLRSLLWCHFGVQPCYCCSSNTTADMVGNMRRSTTMRTVSVEITTREEMRPRRFCSSTNDRNSALWLHKPRSGVLQTGDADSNNSSPLGRDVACNILARPRASLVIQRHWTDHAESSL